uniref:Phage neck terminator protein gp12-like domain-containing protein n=1 Tax=viral metagenome TaxID=1070528 RepID=A0A6M3LL66_9ZZZZ
MSRSVYSPTSYEQGVYTWLRLVMAEYDTALHTVVVYPQFQSAPRPQPPCCSFQVLSGVPSAGWGKVTSTPRTTSSTLLATLDDGIPWGIPQAGAVIAEADRAHFLGLMSWAGTRFTGRANRRYSSLLSVNTFGPQHRNMMRDLIESIEQEDVREIFLQYRAWVTGVSGGPRDLTLILDTNAEGRTQADFRLVYGHEREYSAEVIETASATLEVDGVESTSDTR